MAEFGEGLLEGGLQAAPSIWEAGGDGGAEQAGELVPLNKVTLGIIRMGVDGVAPCTASGWIAALVGGMLAGVWVGVTMLPNVHMPISGGWFSCVCVMTAHLFRKLVPMLRVEVAEGGHLAQLLSSSTSPACAKQVARVSRGLRWFQGLFVLSQMYAYFYGLDLVSDEPWMRLDIKLGVVIFFGGFVVGSFMLVSSMLSILCSCEVLDDRIERLTVQAKGATTMEQLRTVSFALRELDNDVQQLVVVLRPTVMTVSAHVSSQAARKTRGG
jgi:hypothetical protein